MKKQEESLNMRKSETYRNEIKSYIVRTGMTMTEVVDYLSDEYGWGRRGPNPPRAPTHRPPPPPTPKPETPPIPAWWCTVWWPSWQPALSW